jgi:hypothetical protein
MLHFNIQNIIINYCDVENVLKLYYLEKEEQEEKIANTSVKLSRKYKKRKRMVKKQFKLKFPDEKFAEGKILNKKIVQLYIEFHNIDRIMNALVNSEKVRFEYCLKYNINSETRNMKYVFGKNYEHDYSMLGNVCDMYPSWFDTFTCVKSFLLDVSNQNLIRTNVNFVLENDKYVATHEAYEELYRLCCDRIALKNELSANLWVISTCDPEQSTFIFERFKREIADLSGIINIILSASEFVKNYLPF